MVMWIAIGNAVVWGGIILALLLWLMRGTRDTEAQLTRIEAEINRREGG
jgi:hypothetical protein